MVQINKSTLSFLADLKLNNDREWFAANRPRYEEAKRNFELFVQALISEIVKFDPILKGLEPKTCIFRINRDTRFSNDKSPYKTNFGAHIVRGGKGSGGRFAGYYFHVEPGGSMVAGGAFMPPSDWLNAIREKIDGQGNKLVRIASDKEFVRHFGKLEGEALKSAPKGYAKDHQYIDLLRMKSILALEYFSDKVLTGPECYEKAVSAFIAMKPLNDFLNDY